MANAAVEAGKPSVARSRSRKNDRDAPPRNRTLTAAERPRFDHRGGRVQSVGFSSHADSAFASRFRSEERMFGISDLFQWERFVTPTVIKVFYWLAVVISVLLGAAGAVSSLTTMAYNPFVGMIFVIASLLGACMGVIISRILAEFVLIVFRINEHLGAIRNQGTGLRGQPPDFG